LIKKARGITVIILDTREAMPPSVRPQEEIPEEEAPRPTAGAPGRTGTRPPQQRQLSRMLAPGRIVIWDEPVEKGVVLSALASTIGTEAGAMTVPSLLRAIDRREAQGSTFLNEGVAFPHVRVDGLAAPFMALGLTRAGVSDVFTEKPVEIVFLILTPAETSDEQVQLLGLASRAAQNRYLMQALRSVRTPQAALKAIREWEDPVNPD
jgi:mannitol/fructose-specific phosphotransferase system IIA component (Ntr-type)